MKYLRIFTDFRPFTNKMYGKTHIEFTAELCERLTDSPCHVEDIKIQFTMSMLIRQSDVWITS